MPSFAETFQALTDRAKALVAGAFPVEGTYGTLKVSNLRWTDVGPDVAHDFPTHKRQKAVGGSLLARLRGDLTLVDPKGRVLASEPSFPILALPHYTALDSFIVNGNDVQFVNQLLLRPAPYVFPSATTSNIDAKVNAAGGGFKMHLIREGPKQGLIQMRIGSSHYPMYSILSSLGVTDQQLENAWGHDVYERNKEEHDEEAPLRALRALRPKLVTAAMTPPEVATLLDTFLRSKVQDPAVTKLTLGKPYTSITPELLLDTTKKIIDVSNGQAEPDDQESLSFKRVRTWADITAEKLEQSMHMLARNVRSNLTKRPPPPSIPRLLGKELSTVNKAVMGLYSQSDFTRHSDLNNPFDIKQMAATVTVLGDGGIKDTNSITDAMRLVHPSHMAVLDPTATPEGGNIGIVNHLSTGAQIKDGRLGARVFDTKTGKWVVKTVAELEKPAVAFHDQYEWSKGKPTPKQSKIAVREDGRLTSVAADKVDYIFDEPSSFFSLTASANPFLNNNDGLRVLMGSKHVDQALPLADPDVRLVQAEVKPGVGFDKQFGHEMAIKSPVDGVVSKVLDDMIYVKSGRTTAKIPLHYKYPLGNSLSYLTDVPQVKVGDKVKAGQIVANNNFSKDNHLALGRNLRVAFAAFKGHNFEDGIVISESASKKMTSIHKYEVELDHRGELVKGLTSLIANFPAHVGKVESVKYDDDGVVKKGAVVNHGDPIICAVRKVEISPEYDYSNLHKSFRKNWVDVTKYWDGDRPAKVVDVVKTRSATRVFLETVEPMRTGDKLSTAHGSKGIVTLIVPDNEMYRTPDGHVVDLLFNPAGLPGRVNPGHMLEAYAGLIADKTGKTYLNKPFGSGDVAARIRKELKQHGIPEEITLEAPDGSKIDKAGYGIVHWLKLRHVVTKKLGTRAAGGSYSENDQPAKSEGENPQKLGQMEMTALLAHGANHFLHDAMSVKSQRNNEFWNALQVGLPTPPLQKPFVLDKFFAYLRGAGVDVQQHGKFLKVNPVTDKHTLEWSNGEITEPVVIRALDLAPERNGIFDPRITGGMSGEHYSHIALESRIANPVMETALPVLLGMTAKAVGEVLDGKKHVAADGAIVAEAGKGTLTHGDGVHRLLSQIDVDNETRNLSTQLRSGKISKSNMDRAVRRLRLLKALQRLDVKPQDAYTTQHIPVIPPKFRPIYPMPDGSLNVSDSNHLYRELLLLNQQIKRLKRLGYKDSMLAPFRAQLADAARALVGTTDPLTRGEAFKGFIKTIKGPTNKFGFFQSRVVERRQELSGRSTIIPNPVLGLDDVKIPWEIAKRVYRPFLIRRLVTQHGATPLKAREMVDNDSDMAKHVAQREMEERPLLLNRAPSLHKFSMMAFKPSLTQGKAIEVNPLIVSGYNADFDGDAMGVHVPVSEEARIEAHEKLLPSKNLFSPRQDRLMHMPVTEAIMGIYLMTKPLAGDPVKVKDEAEAVRLLATNKIKANTPLKLGGKVWTAGQILLNNELPEAHRFGNKTLSARDVESTLIGLAKAQPKLAPKAIANFKNLGNHYVTDLGWSVSLNDLIVDNSFRDKTLKNAKDEAKLVGFAKAYSKAQKQIQDNLLAQFETNRFVAGNKAGAYGKGDQITRLLSAPVALSDHRLRTIEIPLGKSYAEGQDLAAYWSAMPGARSGLIDKGLTVQDTGALSKQLSNVGWTISIAENDCGTKAGVKMPATSPDALDRVLAHGEANAGHILTPDMVKKIVAKSPNALVTVRSPVTCKSHTGICALCFGADVTGHLHPIGYSVGSLAATSFSEPLTQMVLKNFHQAGAINRSSVGYERIARMLEMPDNVPGKATIAMHDGKVDHVEPVAGGWNVYVNDVPHFLPRELELPPKQGAQPAPAVKKGDVVKAGQQLSASGVIKPQELLEATGDIDHVRDHIINSIHNEFTSAGVKMKRKIIETMVHPITNRVEIIDPGHSSQFDAGDVVKKVVLDAHNADLKKAGKDPVVFRSKLISSRRVPMDDADFLSRLMHREPHRGIMTAVATGASMDVTAAGPVAKMMLKPYMPEAFRKSAELVTSPEVITVGDGDQAD